MEHQIIDLKRRKVFHVEHQKNKIWILQKNNATFVGFEK